MNLQVNENDDFDFMGFDDIDTGDYKLCKECGEYSVFDDFKEFDCVSHEIVLFSVCSHCGAEER